MHLFNHLQKNDRNILSLLSGQNYGLFMECFRSELTVLVESQLPLFAEKKKEQIPEDFWRAHIVSTFISTLNWWLQNAMEQSPEVITQYFLQVV